MEICHIQDDFTDVFLLRQKFQRCYYVLFVPLHIEEIFLMEWLKKARKKELELKFEDWILCLHMQICAHAYVWMWKPESTSSVIPQEPSTIFWQWLCSHLPRICQLTKTGWEGISGMLLLLVTCTGITQKCHHTQFFALGVYLFACSFILRQGFSEK